MKKELQISGHNYDIYSIVLDDGANPAIEFFSQLKQDDESSFKSLINVLKMHADSGPLRNIEKSRPIKGYKDLFEFKSRQGARLPYFYLKGKITIITHGFKKGAPANQEFKWAAKIMAQYLKEYGNG
jgi:hypothetical protein